jgi:hypothetical protein
LDDYLPGSAVICNQEEMSGLPSHKQGLSEAYKWFKLAAEQGKDVGRRLTSLTTSMTSGQLQEGKRRFREFQSKK